MVNLTLAQMAETVRREEQMKKEKEKTDRYDQIDEVAQYAVRRRKMRQERKERHVEGRKNKEEGNVVHVPQEKRTKIVEPDDFDKMIAACESLTFAPRQASKVSNCEYASSPTVEVTFDEMLKRCDALLPPPDVPSVTISAPQTPPTEPSSPLTAKFHELPEPHARKTDATKLSPLPATPSTASTSLNTAAAPPSTHPLRANPPSASDILHARKLTSAHRQPAMAKKPEVANTQSALATFDAMTQYGRVAPQTKMTRCVSAARRARLSMREAFGRGVGRLLGE